MVETAFRTLAAGGAKGTVKNDPSVLTAFSGIAETETATAVGTFLSMKHNLNLCVLGFRIMAPKAIQGTSLKKDSRADAGTVMDAEFLNIEIR